MHLLTKVGGEGVDAMTEARRYASARSSKGTAIGTRIPLHICRARPVVADDAVYMCVFGR